MRSRRFASPALAPLLLCLLAALGCENNSVPETYASGTTPAPVPKVDAKEAARVQVPATPPAEPPSFPAQAEKAAPGVGGELTGSGHLTLTGDYRLDADTRVSCDLFAEKGFTLTFIDPKGPRVQIRIGELIGTGTFQGAVTVSGVQQGVLHESKGAAQVQVTVTPTAQPRHGSLVAGQLSGAFAGDAGKGNLTGRFDHCFFRGGPTS